jgi:hypothetical protein
MARPGLTKTRRSAAGEVPNIRYALLPSPTGKQGQEYRTAGMRTCRYTGDRPRSVHHLPA